MYFFDFTPPYLSVDNPPDTIRIRVDFFIH